MGRVFTRRHRRADFQQDEAVASTASQREVESKAAGRAGISDQMSSLASVFCLSEACTLAGDIPGNLRNMTGVAQAKLAGPLEGVKGGARRVAGGLESTWRRACEVGEEQGKRGAVLAVAGDLTDHFKASVDAISTSISVMHNHHKSRYATYLRSPPPPVIEARQRLCYRADDLISKYLEKRGGVDRCDCQPLDLDVVIPGCAFRVVWFLGVHMVLSRLEAAGLLKIRRYAGSSSGAKAALQLLLTGEESTVERYLSYGMLWHGSSGPVSLKDCRDLAHGCQTPQLWDELCIMEIDNILADYSQHLHRLDDRLAISVTKYKPLPSVVLYTNFSGNPELTKQVYRSTGLAISICDGYVAGDGALTPKGATPLYQDGLYNQLVVDGNVEPRIVSATVWYSLERGIDIIQMGQDAALSFFDRVLQGDAEAWKSLDGPLRIDSGTRSRMRASSVGTFRSGNHTPPNPNLVCPVGNPVRH